MNKIVSYHGKEYTTDDILNVLVGGRPSTSFIDCVGEIMFDFDATREEAESVVNNWLKKDNV